MVEFIAREAFDLSAIIDDLLVAAWIEIGKLEVAEVPTALRAQLAQVIESWNSKETAQIEIKGNNSRANADPARVRQILRNLITNALRYGGEDIEIEDRYHCESTQPGSVGLGLTVARGLAELMEGSLTYRH